MAAAAARDTLPAQGGSKECMALTGLVGIRGTVLSTTVAEVAKGGMMMSRVVTVRGKEVTGLRLAAEQEPALLMAVGLTRVEPQRMGTVTLAVGTGEGTVAVRPVVWPRPAISTLEQITVGRVVSLRAPPATAIDLVTVAGMRVEAVTRERGKIPGAVVMDSRQTRAAIGQMVAPAPAMIRATTAPEAPTLAPAVAMDMPR